MSRAKSRVKSESAFHKLKVKSESAFHKLLLYALVHRYWRNETVAALHALKMPGLTVASARLLPSAALL